MNQFSDWVSILSLVASIVGIVVSSYIAVYVFRRTQSYNSSLIKKDYFDRLFFEILFVIFPASIAGIGREGDTLTQNEYKVIRSNIRIIYSKIQFFRYYESKDFYERIKSQVDNFQTKLYDIYNFDFSKIVLEDEKSVKTLELKESLSAEYKALCDMFLDYIFSLK